MTLRKLPVRGNRSEAVTTTRGWGWGGGVDEMQRGSECFHAKVGDVRGDRCWIMLGKWSMACFTCLVFNEQENMKDEGDYRKRGRC